jgi:hypothetical protein
MPSGREPPRGSAGCARVSRVCHPRSSDHRPSSGASQARLKWDPNTTRASAQAVRMNHPASRCRSRWADPIPGVSTHQALATYGHGRDGGHRLLRRGDRHFPSLGLRSSVSLGLGIAATGSDPACEGGGADPNDERLPHLNFHTSQGPDYKIGPASLLLTTTDGDASAEFDRGRSGGVGGYPSSRPSITTSSVWLRGVLNSVFHCRGGA